MKYSNKYYWDFRYKEQKLNSGSGSYGEEGDFKVQEIVNFADRDIKSILDVGCGDINIAQKIMPHFPKAKYIGLDVSDWIITKNKEKNLGDRWKFEVVDNFDFNYPSDLVICADVLFHIMDDDDYHQLLKALKRNWKKYLFISTYSHIEEKKVYSHYITARKFEPSFFSDRCSIVPVLCNKKSCNIIGTSYYKFIK